MTTIAAAAPEAFIPPSLEFAKRKAKALQHELRRTGRPFALSQIQEAIARLYGHRNWFDLAQRVEKRATSHSSLDDDLDPPTVSRRKASQVELAAQMLHLTAQEASTLVDLVGPCASAARSRQSKSRGAHHALLARPDPGTGELLLSVRTALRGTIDGELTHVDYLDKGPVNPFCILVAAFENGDRLYVRIFEDAPTADQIAQAMTQIRALIGERFSEFHTPNVDRQSFPIARAGASIGASIERATKGRQGARLVTEAEEFLSTLSSCSRELFESFPTLDEIERIAAAHNGLLVVPRRPRHSIAIEDIGPFYQFAESLAAQVCTLRGRSPEEGKRTKARAPQGARPNNHLAAVPLPEPAAAAEEAVIRTRDGDYPDEEVRDLAQFFPEAMGNDDEGREAFRDLSDALRVMDSQTLYSTEEHWRNYISTYTLTSDRLRRNLGLDSVEAQCVTRAVGAYLSKPMRVGSRVDLQLYALSVRVYSADAETPDRINGIPCHLLVQKALAGSLGIEANRFLVDPYFLSDYYKDGNWRGHLALASYIAKGGAGYRQGLQEPLAKGSLRSKPINEVSMDRELVLHGAVTTGRSSGPIPAWQNREQLACALAGASEAVNARLTKWGLSTRIEFTDLKTYDDQARPTHSVMAALPEQRQVH